MPRAAHPLLKKIGLRVRHLREDRGWSQEELADRAEIDRTYVSGIERGLRNASVLTLVRIADALKVSLSDLTDVARR